MAALDPVVRWGGDCGYTTAIGLKDFESLPTAPENNADLETVGGQMLGVRMSLTAAALKVRGDHKNFNPTGLITLTGLSFSDSKSQTWALIEGELCAKPVTFAVDMTGGVVRLLKETAAKC